MGMVSFLSSPVLATFWLTKLKKKNIRRVPLLACFLVKDGRKTMNFMRQTDFAKMGTLLISFFSIFLTKKFPQLANSRKKPFPSNSAHKLGHPQCSEWNRKEESALHFTMGRASWGFLVI
jgi:hypothetical protein